MRIRYLALGDSYTIGTGASQDSRNFPSRLAAKLEEVTGTSVEIKNPAVNGYTTNDLIRVELPELDRFKPDLVTLLIGVNDLVQGSDESSYRARLRQIYQRVRQLGLPPGRVVVISIPDFSVVPAAANFGDPPEIHRRVVAFNAIAREEASSHGFDYVDLTELSRSSGGRSNWIADDGLHPGDGQYEAWSHYIWQQVADRWTTRS